MTALAPLEPGFSLPGQDLGKMLESLGIKLFIRERSLAQYVSWSMQTGLIGFLDEHGPANLDQVVKATSLTEAGADSLLGVMCALGFISRSASADYGLETVARDYLLQRSPFCIAGQIEAIGFSMPRPYLKQRSDLITRIKLRLQALSPSIRYGSMSRLMNQHARNLGAGASAVRSGEFANVGTMVDVAGGSGTFSIPLALDYPDMRIVLAEIPDALPGVRTLLARHGLDRRIVLQELDALQRPWNIPECDGMFFGNFLHGFDDAVCLNVLLEAHCRLPVGGQLWIHEMLWHEERNGPLITALWHAAMRSGGPGRQRTGSQLSQLLERAGFSGIRIVPTSGAYALVTGRKTSARAPA